ncbi:MAG: Fic family protein [Rickettsiales bacterium]|jgi:cell filamentation protein|nr:Fic family protein [Rickettsiales bacterium]
MYEKYKYIDSDSIYTDKRNGVLKNKRNISDPESLLFFESATVAARLKELAAKPVKIKSANDLLKIHRFLFGDVYDWAGDARKVEISKGGRQFLAAHSFPQAFAFIDSLLADYEKIPADDKRAVANKLAEILDNVNFLHPFREGNGRTQREFVRTLALQKGYELNLNPLDDQSVYDRYMGGTINGGVPELAELIWELLK